METTLSREETASRITAARQKLGKDLAVFAHYYQNMDIVRQADFVGDSLQLAQIASKQHEAKYIVFCAVSFMAQMARILCRPEQRVFHPDLTAKCPLAEMAVIDDVERAWKALQATGGKFIPVVYVNSRVDLKEFCGRNGGFVCTSANAKKAMEHVLSRNAVPFFFPDENLGRNTAHAMGIQDNEMLLWDPHDDPSSVTAADITGKKVILWRGFCYVHVAFKPSDVEEVRKVHDGIKVIVHPECTPDVVRISDYAGSTSFIKSTVEGAPAGTKWAIGTEINFVESIIADNPDKLIVPLKPWQCLDMAKITPLNFLTVLENLAVDRAQPEIEVDEESAKYAKIALERMLTIS